MNDKYLVVKYTNKGDRRKNEDSFRYNSNKGIFLIADGIGGHSGGKFASKRAVDIMYESIMDLIKNVNKGKIKEERIGLLLMEYTKFTNRCINTLSDIGEIKNCGTTLDAVILRNGKLYLTHSGDSSVYLINKSSDSIKKLTKEHINYEMFDDDPYLNLITSRSLPISASLTSNIGKENAIIDSYECSFGYDDLLLMTTDGLTKTATDTEIKRIINTNSLDKTKQKLVEVSKNPIEMKTIYDNLRSKGFKVDLESMIGDNTTFMIIRKVK